MDMLVMQISLFVLAVILGVELITKVPATLHTPLMSGSNAISGITLVGALLAAGSGKLVVSGLQYLAWLLSPWLLSMWWEVS